ncbi:MAG: transporter substrate-binding domain-containing protein [Bermanella sp.]
MPSPFFADFWRVFVISLLLVSATSQAQPLIIGAYQYPPFMDEKTKDGLYIQLMKSIQTHSQLEFKWVFYPYARLDRFFNLGKIQLEIGSSPLWHQHKLTPGSFTDSFYQLEDVAIHRSGENRRATSDTDIAGQDIGIVRGYSFPQFQQAFSQKIARRIEGADEAQLLHLLINERIDQVFMSKQVFLYLQSRHSEYGNFVIGDVVGRYDVAIRVHPSQAQIIPALNRTIQILKTNGTIKQLFNKPQP